MSAIQNEAGFADTVSRAQTFADPDDMPTIDIEDADLFKLVERVINGEVVTITRLGEPVAALVSPEAAEIARRTINSKRSGFVAYLRTMPEAQFERNPSPSRPFEF